MQVGDLVMDKEETVPRIYGIILYKAEPSWLYPTTDRWMVQWDDGDRYALPESSMEVVCK